MLSRPLVSWLIPTTLQQHPWQKLLVEFLEDDFPPGYAECLFLGTQDKHFASHAAAFAKQVYDSLPATPERARRWRCVRFLEYPMPAFNLPVSRNILQAEARGDILIHRDADTLLLRPGFTRFAVQELMASRVGLLSFPSLRNGSPFKPKPSVLRHAHPTRQSIMLTSTVNGMATAGIKTLLDAVDGRNPVLGDWGEHTALCTKLARAGFLLGYTQPEPWLSTADGESSISMTDSRNPRVRLAIQKGLALINRFYNVSPNDYFKTVQQQDYDTSDEALVAAIHATDPLFPAFAAAQQLPADMQHYSFGPWECLAHKDTADYITKGVERAAPFYRPVEERIRHLRVDFLTN